MVSLRAFSELLEVLYSAPLIRDQWKRFLTLVSDHTASHNGFFLSADTHAGLLAMAHGHGDRDAEVVSTYNEKYAQTDPIRTALIRRSRTESPIGAFTDEDLLPNHGLLATELYRELLAHSGLRYGAFMISALSVRRLDAISLWRTVDEGPIDADSRHLLRLLIPHVQTALEARRALGLAEQRLASAEAMANASSTATFVLNHEGLIHHLNTAAEALVRSGDGLTLTQGHLTSRITNDSEPLARLFRDAGSASLTESAPNRFLALARPSGKRPLQLIATPLPEEHRLRSHADLLLVVTDPEQPSNLTDAALQALYHLTPAEAEVANGLLLGYSSEEIACLRRVSASTVRQQIKSLLSKTGTSRQSEMVRLLMRLPQSR